MYTVSDMFGQYRSQVLHGRDPPPPDSPKDQTIDQPLYIFMSAFFPCLHACNSSTLLFSQVSVQFWRNIILQLIILTHRQDNHHCPFSRCYHSVQKCDSFSVWRTFQMTPLKSINTGWETIQVSKCTLSNERRKWCYSCTEITEITETK